MPRRVRTDRLETLIDAATGVFLAKGYRRSQMADITAALGLSEGAIYRYVASKEALFDLVLRAAADDLDPAVLTLPVATPTPGATLAFVERVVERDGQLPPLAIALTQTRVADPVAELTDIVRQLYRLMARHRQGIALVERSALDWPELAALWFGRLRGRLIDQLAQYLALRIAHGLLRPVPDATAAARLIVEVCAFFAMHRHGDPFPTPMDEATAETTAVDALVHAYAHPSPASPP